MNDEMNFPKIFMKRILPAVAVFLMCPAVIFAQDMQPDIKSDRKPDLNSVRSITGTWSGKLKAGNQELELIFRFGEDADGNPEVTMDVPAQSAVGMPVKVNALTADSVSMGVARIMMSYTGRLEDGTIRGTFRQMGASFPLDLVQGAYVKPARPQEPQPPFPYRMEDLEIHDPGTGVCLSATLTYPLGNDCSSSGSEDSSDEGIADASAECSAAGCMPGSAVPVVVMVSGSGGQNRDEEVFGHKPFLVIADYLARHGIASLRYDDRGVGKSTGTQAGCTSEDFADDAARAVEYLRSTGRFGKTGVLGHSEGGMIAFMLGAEGKVDFIVSMAGPGLKGDTLLAEQQNAIMKLRGMPAASTVKSVRQSLAAQAENAWLEYFINYDPADNLSCIDVPVMAINGGNDVQVIADSNMKAIEAALSGRNPHSSFVVYPELNHLFQHCTPETAMDYYTIVETCSEEVLEDIAEWINGLCEQ